MNDVIEYTMREIFVPYTKTENWHKDESYRFLPARFGPHLRDLILSLFNEDEDMKVVMSSEKVYVIFPACVKHETMPSILDSRLIHLEHGLAAYAEELIAEHGIQLRTYDWDTDLDSGLRTNY